jgi:hypothetical protein
MRTILYGKKAANLYTQAFVQNTQARALYQESEDTYYRANDAASYDDWRRARHQWDYFYNRYVFLSRKLVFCASFEQKNTSDDDASNFDFQIFCNVLNLVFDVWLSI